MTIEFPDVSHYQSGVKLNGAPAVVAKCTQGTGYVDVSYSNFRKQAASLRIPFSGYHWLDTTDPGAQARWYHTNAGGAPCMWDAEATGATVPRILAATAALKAAGGHAWGAYLPHWWWEGHIGSPDLRPLAAAGLVLVSSNYTTTPLGAGWAPYGGVTPTVWQYTDKQPLNGVPCDFNRFHGTAADLAALFTGSPSPTEDDMLKFVRVSDGSTTGAVWLTNGVSRYHIPDPGAYAIALKTWGQTTADVISIHEGELPAYGADVALAGTGASPATIAKAVNDDAAARLAS